MRDVRHELVLQRIELEQLRVLEREQLLRLLGLAAREPLGAARALDGSNEAAEPHQNDDREHGPAEPERV
jgi:hypothetical protein